MSRQSMVEGFTLTAGGPARTFRMAGSAPASVEISDGATAVALDGVPDFRITVSWEMLQFQRALMSPVTLSSADFRVVEVSAVGTRAPELAVTLVHDALALTVRIIYGADPTRGTLTKDVVVHAEGPEPLHIEEVVLDTARLRGDVRATSGYGQPILGDTWWAGVRHPGGYTRVRDGIAELGIDHVGVLLRPGDSWHAPETVWGFAPDGDARRSFLLFVDAVRSRPVRRCVSVNSWYDLQGDDLNEAAVLDRLARFDQLMTVERGTPPDVYVIDDYWDDRHTAWDVNRTTFPHGFSLVEKAAETTAFELGLWFGPVGGYHQERAERVAWYRANGYEVSLNGEHLCLGGTSYRAQFLRQLEQKLGAHRFGYLKLDGMSFTCLHQGHGHEPGAASRLHLIESFIEVLLTARRLRPEVFLSVTTGMWLSPWWLQWVDAVFIGGDDYNWDDQLPVIEPRDSATTYRDGVMYDDFVTAGDAFPISSLMSMGLIKGDLQRLGGPDESREAWRRDVAMEVGRGVMQTELYVSPDALTDGEWDDLCSALRWARRNDDVLLGHGEMLLGDPRKGDPYGYAHRGATRSIITVRNPSLRPRRIELDVRTWAPRSGGDATWREVYPGHRPAAVEAGALVLDLGPNAVVVLEAGPRSQEPAQPLPVPAVEATATVDVVAVEAGCRLTIELAEGSADAVVLVAEGLAGEDAEAWQTDGEMPVDRAHGARWSVVRCLPHGRRVTALLTAPQATISAWLWSREPLDGDGTGAGPFARQDQRVSASLIWSGAVQGGALVDVDAHR